MSERKALGKTRGGISMDSIRPTRLYTQREVNYEDINEGDFIIARVEQFIPPSTILLKCGTIDAQMSTDDFFSDLEHSKSMKAIYASTGKPMATMVKKKEKSVLLLERAPVISNTIAILSQNVGNVVDATVESIADFGLFCDIGNGVVSMLPKVEISKSRIFDLSLFFKIGDSIRVRILSYDSESLFFYLSRKQAYDQMNEVEFPRDSSIVVTCSDYIDDNRDGVFVEYDPANSGIVDIPKNYRPEDFYPGRKMSIAIKGIKEKGFKGHFINFID